jgi:hypothetical protein
MQAVITHPGGVLEGVNARESRMHIDIDAREIETVITPSSAMGSVDRLEIYAKAYFARLLECLRAVFPILTRALGEELFDEFAVGYLEKYPSSSYTLNRLGENFSRYLDETRPPDESWAKVLVDLAKLEWTIGEVFDGPGSEGSRLITADVLKNIPADRRPEVRLKPAPGVRTLALRHPVLPYYNALLEGLDVLPPPSADSFLALTRRDYVVRIHELSPMEFMLLTALLEGRSVAEAVALVPIGIDSDIGALAEDVQRWFHNWSAAGFFQSIEIPSPPGAGRSVGDRESN